MVDLQTEPLLQAMNEVIRPSIQLRIVKLFVQLPDKEFTGREIAGLLGVSHSNVQRAMRILVDNGFAMKRRIGRADVFRGNKDHFLFKPLRELFVVERKLPEQIADELRSEYGPLALSITVFGSYARGTADRRSDLDVLVVTREPELADKRTLRLQSHFMRKYGVPLSVKVISASDLGRKPLPPYLRAAVKEGLLISGEPLEKVTKLAK